jgi:DNA-binding transcriptional LysR family regulator
MDLNHVATFVRVVEKESFTAAAEALGVPKSSVSRGVAKLEEDLGVRLLQRTTRKLSLTDAGRAYYERARAVLEGLDEAGAELSDRERDPRGVVRVTAPVDIGVLVLADIVAPFVRERPAIHVELALTSRLVNMVEEGFDLAVRAGRLADSSLVARKLGEIEIGLFASAAYLERRGRPKKLADLASHDCILFRAAGGRATWRLDGPRGEENVDVVGAVVSDDMLFTQRMISAGVGIGQLPRLPKGCTDTTMVRVLPEYASSPGPLHVVWPSARHVPARVALFRDHVIASFAAMKWNGK